jgi:hypothetical protein
MLVLPLLKAQHTKKARRVEAVLFAIYFILFSIHPKRAYLFAAVDSGGLFLVIF